MASAALPTPRTLCFSALQRAEIAEMLHVKTRSIDAYSFSALQRAEIAEIIRISPARKRAGHVSVLFNEPKLLKSDAHRATPSCDVSFSALQRAEIAEIPVVCDRLVLLNCFSALQRAEIAEIVPFLRIRQ